MLFSFVCLIFVSCGEMSVDFETKFENEETFLIDMNITATGLIGEQLSKQFSSDISETDFPSDSEININYEDEVFNFILKGRVTGEEAKKYLKVGCEQRSLTTINGSTPLLCVTIKDLGYAKEYQVSSSILKIFLQNILISLENDHSQNLEELNALAKMFPNMLTVNWGLEVPGEIIQSNGKMLSGSKVEWKWNLKDLVSQVKSQNSTDLYAIYIVYSTSDLWSKVVRVSDILSEQLNQKRQNVLFGPTVVEIEKLIEIIKEIPVEKIVIKEVEIPVEVVREVIVEKKIPVEVVREVIVEKIVVKEVEVLVEVVKEVIVEKIVVKEVIKEVYITPEPDDPKNKSSCTTGDPSSVVVDVPPGKIYQFGLTRYFYGSSNGSSTKLKKYCQSPALDSMTLESIDKRIPENPLVITGPDGVGQFGGTLRLLCSCENDERDMIFHDGLVSLDLDGKTIVPNLAESWSLSGDGKIWSFGLRKGIKWSDGVDLTANDIAFSFQHLINDRRVTAKMPRLFSWDRKKTIFSIIDDYNIEFTFNPGYLGFLHGLSRIGAGSAIGSFQGGLNWLISPAHYMKKYHVAFDNTVPQQALDEGYPNWVEFLKAHTIWYRSKGLNTPVITPWISQTSSSSDVWKLKRNPYFWVVDTVGNQLPYIDNVEALSMPSLELRNASYLIGKADFGFEGIQYNKVSTLLDLGKSGVFDIDLRPSHIQRSVIIFNQTYEYDSEIADLLRNSGFRRAISFAINRDRINESVFNGIGVIRDAIPPLWMEDYPGEDFANRYITYNPGASNSILDALGLWKVGNTWRQRKDGGGIIDLTIYPVPNKLYDTTVVANLIADNIQAIGIRTTIISQAVDDNTYQIVIDDLETDMFFNASSYVPLNEPYYAAIEVGKWYNSRGLSGKNPEINSHLSDFSTIFDFYQNSLALSGVERYENNIGIIRRAIDDLYWIGTVGNVPRVSLKNPSLKGVAKGPFMILSHRYLFWFDQN